MDNPKVNNLERKKEDRSSNSRGIVKEKKGKINIKRVKRTY